MLIALCNNLGSQYYEHGRATIRTDQLEAVMTGMRVTWAYLPPYGRDMRTCQASLSCGFPSSVQEVLSLDIRLDSLCFSRHAQQENRGSNHSQKSARHKILCWGLSLKIGDECSHYVGAICVNSSCNTIQNFMFA